MLALLGVVPLAGLLFYTATEQRRLEIEAIKRNAFTLADFAAREEEHLLDGTRQFLAGLALYLGRQETESADWNSHLADLLKDYSRYRNIGAVDARGAVYCSALSHDGVLNVGDRAWFQRALTAVGFTAGGYEAEMITGSPVMVFAYPITASDGRARGVVFAALDVHWLSRLKLGIEGELPNGTTIAQIDERGMILAHRPDPDAWIGRSLNRGPLLEALRSNPTGMTRASDPDGRKRLYAYSNLFSALGNQQTYLLVGIPEEALFIEADRLLVHNLVLLGIAACGVMLAAWFGSDLLVLRPVRIILNAAGRLASGDLSARTGHPRSSGELNELAQAFDAMAAALERRAEERGQAEAELRRSREQLRNLSAHLESAREEERIRLAREIHDELGQDLAALKMDLSWLGKRLEPRPHPIDAKIRSMHGLVDETIRTVQRLCGELRPSLLDDLGLEAAIEWQAEEFQKRAGIACDVQMDLGAAELPPGHATAVFRIFQETLTNVLRHARASRVDVRLQVVENRWVLEVEDNGRGITEAEAKAANAFGLIGMRERVLALKGRIDICGRPGRGTTVTVSVPLAPKGNDP